MEQPVDKTLDAQLIVPAIEVGIWAQLMVTALSDCDYTVVRDQIRDRCGDGQHLLRALFVSYAAVAAQAHFTRATHHCEPIDVEMWGLAESTPAPQGQIRARDTAAAVGYLTSWFSSSSIPAINQLVHDWNHLTEAQQLATVAISVAYMRGELAHLPPTVVHILSHTISRSPRPQAIFSHFYGALWATSVLEGNQPGEVAIADRLAEYPPMLPRDIAWICLGTVAARLEPGAKARLPAEAIGCPCPDGITAAGMVSDWVTEIAAGAPNSRKGFKAAFKQALATGADLPKHAVLAAVYWMAQDWQHGGVRTTPA